MTFLLGVLVGILGMMPVLMVSGVRVLRHGRREGAELAMRQLASW